MRSVKTLHEGIPKLGVHTSTIGVKLPCPYSRPVAKGLPTAAAHVRLSGVKFSVLNDVGALAKGLATLATLVRPLSCVNSLVLNEVGLLAEGFLTLVTLIRPGSRVNSPVLI